MGFDAQVAPGLNNLPRLRQSAKVSPLRDGALNLFYRLGVSERRQIAQRLVEQDGAQRAAHVFARTGFRKRGHHEEIRGDRGDALLAPDQALEAIEVLVWFSGNPSSALYFGVSGGSSLKITSLLATDQFALSQ